MILYIHGFGTTGNSFKSSKLKEFFPSETILSPTLTHEPEKDFNSLSELLGKYKQENNLIIGTSLGGYYAYLLSQLTNTQCALINPSLEPENTLFKYIGEFKNYNTGVPFVWKPEHIDQLIKLKKKIGKTNHKLVYTYIGLKDKEINNTKIKEKLPGCYVKLYKNESHIFNKFELLLPEFKKIILTNK